MKMTCILRKSTFVIFIFTLKCKTLPVENRNTFVIKIPISNADMQETSELFDSDVVNGKVDVSMKVNLTI